MSIGVIGRKVGMTSIFTPEGESVPVSVVEVEPNDDLGSDLDSLPVAQFV